MLQAGCPSASASKLKTYLPYINQALTEGKINTCKRQAAFLAQLAHESGCFIYMEEIASGAAYEGRRDLGNTQPGDGRRFKGRGPIQLTGRANYVAAGKALKMDLVNHPETVAQPSVGFRTSVWFWTKHNLNSLADQGTLASFKTITSRINGGQNGAADREAKWAKFKKAIPCNQPAPSGADGASSASAGGHPTSAPPATVPQGSDCGKYATEKPQSILGNGNVKYSVVKILPEHIVDPSQQDNMMTLPTACAFNKMANAARQQSVIIKIRSAFRTLARQQYFWGCYRSGRCNGGNLAAHPGTSNHGKGQALDLNVEGSGVLAWLNRNAGKYGFRRTVPSENWHWEYLPK